MSQNERASFVTPFNKAIPKPKLEDVLREWARSILLETNCHAVVTIQSFNPENQSVSATMNYRKTYATQDSLGGAYKERLIEYPVMIEMPVICLGGGGFNLTFPIKKGDEALVCFNDRDIDNWFDGSNTSAPNSDRLHAFSDGIAIVGLHSKRTAIQNYDMLHALLTGPGGAKLGVSDTKVLVQNNLHNLNALLQELIFWVQNLAFQTANLRVTGVDPGVGVSGDPFNATQIEEVRTKLGETADKIKELLE